MKLQFYKFMIYAEACDGVKYCI